VGRDRVRRHFGQVVHRCWWGRCRGCCWNRRRWCCRRSDLRWLGWCLLGRHFEHLVLHLQLFHLRKFRLKFVVVVERRAERLRDSAANLVGRGHLFLNIVHDVVDRVDVHLSVDSLHLVGAGAQRCERLHVDVRALERHHLCLERHACALQLLDLRLEHFLALEREDGAALVLGRRLLLCFLQLQQDLLLNVRLALLQRVQLLAQLADRIGRSLRPHARGRRSLASKQVHRDGDFSCGVSVCAFVQPSGGGGVSTQRPSFPAAVSSCLPPTR
ncbi:TPA: hypothetical protein N0F65_012106, partial [Lagenidium giganteum]